MSPAASPCLPPLLLALSLLASPAIADVYKCRLPDGRTQITNAPCPSGSGTLGVRSEESIPESSRQQAERDLERMRAFVEQRETAQRAETAAELEAARRASPATAPRAVRPTGNPDECLRELGGMVLEATQRATMEADCRRLVNPQPRAVPYPVIVPAWPVRPPYPRHAVPPQRPAATSPAQAAPPPAGALPHPSRSPEQPFRPDRERSRPGPGGRASASYPD